MHNLYVLFSATPYKMGMFIRTVTCSTYNHVSLSLDPQLEELYAFARRYYKTPFYGGFVRETPGRYYHKGLPSRVKLCRIPLTEAQYTELQALLSQMYRRREQYLYNHFSALAVPLRRRIPVQDAYLCVEFCVEILRRAGLDVDPRGYHSIKSTEALLSPHCCYTGPFPFPAKPDPDFFAKKPLSHPYFASLRSVLALFPRLRQNPKIQG